MYIRYRSEAFNSLILVKCRVQFIKQFHEVNPEGHSVLKFAYVVCVVINLESNHVCVCVYI